MVIAGYELGSGCGPYWIAWFINLAAFTLGLVVCPRPMFRAFVRGRRARSVYDWNDRPSLRAMTVADLRTALHIPADTSEVGSADRAAFLLWSTAAIATAIAPLIFLVAVLRLL
jgi:hypothetical protein